MMVLRRGKDDTLLNDINLADLVAEYKGWKK